MIEPSIHVAIEAHMQAFRRSIALITMNLIIWQFQIQARRMIRTLDQIGGES